jgi:hypothetical protein
MDTRKIESGVNRWYICLEPKVKMEIPVKVNAMNTAWSIEASLFQQTPLGRHATA